MTEAPINEQSVNAAAASSSTTPSSIHVEAPSSDPFAQRWDSSSTASDDCSEEDVDDILDYTLQLVYGVDLHDGTVNASQSRQAVKDFVRQLGQNIWQTPADTQSSNGHSSSSNSSLCTPGCTSGSGEANNINSRGGSRQAAVGMMIMVTTVPTTRVIIYCQSRGQGSCVRTKLCD